MICKACEALGDREPPHESITHGEGIPKVKVYNVEVPPPACDKCGYSAPISFEEGMDQLFPKGPFEI